MSDFYREYDPREEMITSFIAHYEEKMRGMEMSWGHGFSAVKLEFEPTDGAGSVT